MDVNTLVGKTLISVTNIDDEVLQFKTDTGETYALFHEQDCCEIVDIESIVGELADLVGSPILLAEEVVSNENPEDAELDLQDQDSFTWTFYKFATIKGYVDVRWYGESNGYYSESVTFNRV